MKVKSSDVLSAALTLVEKNEQQYACAAIQDVETDLRYANNGRDVKTNASRYFSKYKPDNVPENMRASQGWWPKGSEQRLEALRSSIQDAKKKGD